MTPEPEAPRADASSDDHAEARGKAPDVPPERPEFGDEPPTISQLYRLMSPESRAHYDAAMSELIYTLDRLPPEMLDPWVSELRARVYSNDEAIRDVKEAEAKGE